MKNVVFIPNINLGNGRSDNYNYSINSWKQWCDKNNCELIVWEDLVLPVEEMKITWERYYVLDILDENNQALSSFGNCLEIRVIDFESRLIMLENNLSRRTQIINNKLVNRHTVRISFLEKSINDMETELKKIKKYVSRRK